MPPKGLMHKDTPLNEDMNTLSVEGAQHSATPQTRPHLSHPISYYYHPSNPLPYYLSPAGKYIRELFAKENRCNDCRQVGHGYKTCTNRRQGSFTRSDPRSIDNHEVLIQELTSQLDDNLKLTASIDPDETSYALFHPPLVIQASAATDGHTSIATSPAALRFLLDTGASRSFCCSVRVRVM